MRNVALAIALTAGGVLLVLAIAGLSAYPIGVALLKSIAIAFVVRLVLPRLPENERTDDLRLLLKPCNTWLRFWGYVAVAIAGLPTLLGAMLCHAEIAIRDRH